jgi:cGMP-dependent protein kinase
VWHNSIVAAVSACRLWAINRQTFQAIMMKTGMAKHTEYVNLLKRYTRGARERACTTHSVPLFRTLNDNDLHRLADVLDEETYRYGEYIVRQGNACTTFYILSKGQVSVCSLSPTTPIQLHPR